MLVIILEITVLIIGREKHKQLNNSEKQTTKKTKKKLHFWQRFDTKT